MSFEYGDVLFAVHVFSVDGYWAWAYWISGLDYFRESDFRFPSSEAALIDGKRNAEEHIGVEFARRPVN